MMTSQPIELQQSSSLFKADNSLIAIKLLESNQVLLNYLEFFFKIIPAKKLQFVHVLPVFDAFHAFVEKNEDHFRNLVALNEAVSNDIQNNIRENFADFDGEIQVEVREGNPLSELLKISENQTNDLTIIGQSSINNQHGILSKKLARKTKSNALVIPDYVSPQLKKILVPIDFSDHSAKALNTAISLAEQMETTPSITCLNVFEMPDINVYTIQKGAAQFKKMVEQDRKNAFERFMRKHVPNFSVPVQFEVVEKSMPGTASYILEYAEKNDYDFLAIGAKGHSTIERLLLGSVTESLLAANNFIPCLIVK